MAQRLVVVYAKSGMGKSSLINAGLKEMLWDKGVLPLLVRLNDRDAGPLKTLYEGIEQAVVDRKVEHTPGETATLWHYFKTAEFWRGDLLLTPLLILDQFEELFTLQSPERRDVFSIQLAELIRGVRPSAQTGKGSRRLSDAPPDVKVLLSLREDYLGQLEELSSAIPQILDTRFRLGPLFEREARQAVEEPGRLEDPRLETKPFTYAPEALDGICVFLSRRLPGQVVESKPYVEPFQLQLVCQRAEEIALDLQQMRADGQQIDKISHEVSPARPDDGPVTVTWEALGKEAGLRTTLASFYERQIATLPSQWAKRRVRRLCEYGLISVSGRRLSLEESEIQRTHKVTKETLDKLVELRLLRADTRVGSVYYELSHDTLVEPILAARRRREVRRKVVQYTLALVVVLGVVSPMAVSWLTRESLRRSLARDLGWAPISAPATGQFIMGCVPNDKNCREDERRHAAGLARNFWIMTHEVTVEQFRRFIADARATMVGRWRVPRDLIMNGQPDWSGDNHPVVNVTWFDATAFCEFIGGRLPTEAEWEYAARGGSADTVYPWGDTYSAVQAKGAGSGVRGTAPVKSFPPNGYALYDMIGNAWEWSSSVYRQYPYEANDGREDPTSRDARVVRGGSWYGAPEGLRVSVRNYFPPAIRYDYFGFRCARDDSP